MRNTLILSLLLLILIAGFQCSRENLLQVHSTSRIGSDQSFELKYFPSGQALNLMSFGFKNTFANLLWFQTVNYFGKHYRSDKEFTWLSHMCSVVTDLDPQHMDIYEFCALLLAWESNQPEQAVSILKKAINNRPDFWRNYYLRAMIAIIFSLNAEEAKMDLVQASNLPDCPIFIKNLASRKISALQSPEETIAFLQQMAVNSKDQAQREALTERWRKAVHEKNIIDIEGLLVAYEQQYGQKAQDLKSLEVFGVTAQNLRDPFGGSYYLSADGEVLSTSKQEILYLFKKRNNDEASNLHK